MSSASPWLRQLAGRFIVFDGPDGSGKSTQFAHLVEAARGANVAVCEVREPGGTAIGEQIRDVLLDPRHGEMDVRAEMLLYMASRAQLIAERIRPALDRGELVLADRFVSSTLAYQGTAGGLEPEEILAVARVAVGDCWPDLTVIFDVDEQTAASRLNPLLDRMEQKGAAFHGRVREGFLEQARSTPDRYAVLDATQPIEHVTRSMMRTLRVRLAGEDEDAGTDADSDSDSDGHAAADQSNSSPRNVEAR